MRPGAVLCVAVILFVAAQPGRAQTLGIYADPASASCSLTAPLYVPTTFYVNVVGSGSFTPSGIQGAAYRLVVPFEQGVDAVILATPSPNCDFADCDPVDENGAYLFFVDCRTGPSVQVQSFNLLVLSPGAVDGSSMRIEGVDSVPGFDCPLVSLCDSPVFTTVCVEGGSATINAPCTVAVGVNTWSEVKALFH